MCAGDSCVMGGGYGVERKVGGEGFIIPLVLGALFPLKSITNTP